MKHIVEPMQLQTHSFSNRRLLRIQLNYPYKLNLKNNFDSKAGRPSVFKVLTTKPSWLRSQWSTQASTIRTGMSYSICISNVENMIWLRFFPLIKSNFQELFLTAIKIINTSERYRDVYKYNFYIWKGRGLIHTLSLQASVGRPCNHQH